MTQKILVVDDDVRLQELLARYLSEQGYTASTAGDFRDMQQLTQRHTFHLYILDINLPGLTGLQICKQLRASGDQTPIIMLTARREEVDRIIGLEIGADDYLAKPFNPRELLARIRSVLRRNLHVRTNVHTSEDFTYAFDDFVLDADRQQLTHKGQSVPLTHNEFALLKMLAQNQGTVLSRTQLSARIYARDHSPDQRDIDMMVSRIRKQLAERNKNSNYIQTIRGIGYKFQSTTPTNNAE